MASDWLDVLTRVLTNGPPVLAPFEGERRTRLRGAQHRADEFAIDRSHELSERVRVPTSCPGIGRNDDGSKVHFRLVNPRNVVTTLRSRIKTRRVLPVRLSPKAGIIKVITGKAHMRNPDQELSSRVSDIALTSELRI